MTAKASLRAATLPSILLAAGVCLAPIAGQAQDAPGLISLPKVTTSAGIVGDGPLPSAQIVLPFAVPPAAEAPAATPAATPPADAPLRLFGPRRIEEPVQVADAAAPVAVPEVTEISGLWPHASGATRGTTYRFSGERDVAEFTLFAPAHDMPRELVLATISSAFVKPGVSTAKVFIGKTEIGTMDLDAIQQTEETRFAIPPGTLDPGRNLVRIEVQQAHRHFCGAEAAYNLWTDLELRQSGVAYDPEALGADATSFLTAVATARAQDRAIKLRVPAGSSEFAHLPEIVHAVNAALGGGLRFRTVSGPLGNAGAGPEILITESPDAGFDFQEGPSDQQILALRLNKDKAPNLAELLGRPLEQAQPTLLPTDVPIYLSALGLGDARIADHLWEQSAEFLLPDNWMVETNAQAEMKLDFAYVSGMPDGARLRFVVNGEVMRMIPLEPTGRKSDNLLPVRFDASKLHAGRNIIGFEISLPGAPADEPCLINQPPLVELGPDTSLTIPGSPKMHMPGIGRAMSAITVSSLHLGATGPDAPVDSLLTLAAALPDTPERVSDTPALLKLVRAEDLKVEDFGSFLANRKMFADTLRRSPNEIGPLTPAPSSVLGSLEVPVDDGFGLNALAGRVLDLNRIRSDVSTAVTDVVTPIRALAFPQGPDDLAAWLSTRTAEAILFQLDPSRPDTVYLVLGDDADAAQVTKALAETLSGGTPLDGHVATLDRKGTWSKWTDLTRMPVLEEPININNWQGIAGNYASQRPMIYLGGIIGIVFLSVMIASLYVVTTQSRK